MKFSEKSYNIKSLGERADFVAIEKEVSQYWDDIGAFEKQLELTKDYPLYTFYDGPPFATGKPHYGHICAGTIKDVITRWHSMNGRHVPRVFGWDCHGLPVEHLVDKEMGIKDRRKVLEIGIDKYNDYCRSVIMRYSNDWREMVKRMGRWIEFDGAYKTMDKSFMESVWWVFKQVYDQGLVYRGCRVMPYSNACNTVLSNFEANLNYQDVSDPSVIVSFKVEGSEDEFLVWTTTPWTLPSNLALTVNPDFTYLRVKDISSGRIFILAECRLCEIYKSAKETSNENIKNKKKTAETKPEYEILDQFKGSDLNGKSYIPLFPYFKEKMTEKGCFKIICGDFVKQDSGTGIVHTAPAYGDEDYKVCIKNSLIEPDDPCLAIDENGRFLDFVTEFAGKDIKASDPEIIKYLQNNGRIYRNGSAFHSYPFCWRSNTPLIYKAINTWFIKVSSIKERILENNKRAYWVPNWAQEKRFNNWLEAAEDWCFSRSRFWGCPIPIWMSDDGEEVVCIGSIEELRSRANLPESYNLNDIHREFIDKIEIPSEKGKGSLKRIDEVFDCWFESGAMPYASIGYPLKTNEDDFKKRFPAEFIGEGLDQTRGWFYTLNILGTILFDKCPYNNIIVNGIVLSEKGEKLSKSKANFPDPTLILDKAGADALRLYLMNSPLVRGDSLKFNEKQLIGLLKDVFIPLYNILRLLIQEINRLQDSSKTKFIHDETLFSQSAPVPENILDRWILARTHEMLEFVRKEFKAYRLYTVLEFKLRYLNDLSNWYIKLNKLRLKGEGGESDTKMALNVLFHCFMLMSITFAPFIPFISEFFYQNMRQFISSESPLFVDSIHLFQIPQPSTSFFKYELTAAVEVAKNALCSVRNTRENRKVNLKQPISSLTLHLNNKELYSAFIELEDYLREEANVAEIRIDNNYTNFVKFDVVPNFKKLGEKLKGTFGEVKGQVCNLSEDQKTQFLKEGVLKIEYKNGVVELCENDLIAVPKVVAKPQNDNIVITGDKDIAIEMDFSITEDLKYIGLAREAINRIQKFRKVEQLKIDDPLYFRLCFKENSQLSKTFTLQENLFKKILKKPVFDQKTLILSSKLKSSTASVDDEEFEIEVYSRSMIADLEKLKDLLLDDSLVKSALTCLSSVNPDDFDKDKLVFSINDREVILNKGVHFNLY